MQSSSLTFLSALKQHCATSEFPLRDTEKTRYSSAVIGHVSLAFWTFIFAFSFQMFNFYVLWRAFLWVYSLWDLLDFLTLWLMSLINLGMFSGIVSPNHFSIPFSLSSKSSVATNVGTSVTLQQISGDLFTLFQCIFCFRSSEFQWFIHSLLSGLSTQQVVLSFLQFPLDLCLKFLVFKIFSLASREIMIESFCESYFKILPDMSYI